MHRDLRLDSPNGNSTNGARSAARVRHLAIVCDGNARWAHARGLTTAEGHAAAADNVLARVADAIELGVRELTLYAFSTENWARPTREVGALLSMLATRIERDTPLLHTQGVRVAFIGRRDRAGRELAGAMELAERMTCENTALKIFVAFDYGGRDEILRAAERYRGGGEREFAKLLYAPEMHDPDLVIRTGGEQRLSNFLLWRCAYSELTFRPEMWPEFDRCAIEECLAQFRTRERRFGARLHARSVAGVQYAAPIGLPAARA
jgi:undecaprenyl diphosphate synthase